VFRRIRAEIDLDALRYNHAVAERLAGEREVWPVVKADAYGHGMLTIARALPHARGFCVADVQEALALREGGIRAPVLVLQGAWDAASLRAAVDAGISLVVHEPGQAALVEAQAEALVSSASQVWLEAETGMHRLGLPLAEVPALRRRLETILGRGRVGLMTHFACADEPTHALNARQQTAFATIAIDAGGPTSACNSAALITDLYPADSVVRPGIMLYGSSPIGERSAADLDLVPVMTLRSRLVAEKTVAAGETVGYGGTWTADRDVRIGLVAAGYGDGYPRHAPSGTPVRIGAATARIVGRVSMDSIAVDLTEAPDARVGSAVVLWGEGLPVDTIAAHAGTIGYELVTRMPPRVPRVALDRTVGEIRGEQP
jgi:alanine racemase